MFPSDSHAMRHLHQAEMQVAHQRRTNGEVVRPTGQRWHQALLAKLTIRLNTRPARPDTTAFARAQRRYVQSTVPFSFIDASTGRRLLDD